MASPTKPTTFLALPVEIRNLVYVDLFGIHRIELQRTTIDSGGLPDFGSHPRSSQILRVCKQVYEEAYLVFMDQTPVIDERCSTVPFGLQVTWSALNLFATRFEDSIRRLEYHIHPQRSHLTRF